MSDNKVTLDQLDNSAVEAMSSSVGDVSMLNTENKTIVGALVEIVGKKEIANAIGEPLAETDKFTEMSSEINGLLSTFKTNMMNAGVVVESGDKFKALIEKIQGLTEGEGNKGIQFAEGVYNLNEQVKLGSEFTLNIAIADDIGFSPTYVFVYIPEMIYSGVSSIYNTIISNTNLYYYASDTNALMLQISDNIISLAWSGTGAQYYRLDPCEINWYAIGVGEEDTTLRDSLASILTEEGVSVTEEDDMASLITKVDEEFEEKRLSLLEALTVKNIPINDNDSFDTLIGYISLFENYNLPSPNELSIYDSIEVIENAGGITFEKNTDHMLITIPQTSISYSLLIGTNTKYDLTDYANIVVEYYSSTGRFALGINDSSQDFTSCDHVESYIGESNYDTLTTYKLNISDYNNEYYILFNIDAASAYGGSLKLYQIYLEK